MGILQRAVETYDCHQSLVGVYAEKKIPLAPVSHIITNAHIEIQLNRDGKFLMARRLEKQGEKTIIPATEESAGRTSGDCAHPLCDNLSYLGGYNQKRYELYLNQLQSWVNSAYTHPLLTAVLHYVQSGFLLSDLVKEGVIECNEKGLPKDEKLLVRWCVVGLEGFGTVECWRDQKLFSLFTAFYAEIHERESKGLCIVLGEDAVLAKQHPKGIVPVNGNAKLISANDNSGFTYRGRFTEETQAATVSYIASQKAHNALRWLNTNQGVFFGGRAFLCWNPQGCPMPNPNAWLPGESKETFTPSNYQEKLYNSLVSFKKENQLTGEETAVMAAFDAATTGRLSLTYYAEQMVNDLLQRMYNWDTSCCWVNGKYGVQSPPLYAIVNNAFGTQQNGKMKVDDKLFPQQMQRLLSCKLSGDQRMPFDFVQALVHRASTPQAYERNVWLNILFTACAVLRKFRKDTFGEEWLMALDLDNNNRSYLFGRLLAIAEKVEQDTYDREETRLTNALKMQSVFARRPFYAWRILEESLVPYYQRQRPASRQYYKHLTGDIMDKLLADAEALNKPLEDIYLLGYYHQRQALYQKKNSGEDAAEENED